MFIDYLAAYIIIGGFAGLLAGLLGVGGGLVVVPALLWLFTLQGVAPEVLVHLAVGTSLATIFATSLSSTLAHHRHQAVRWRLFADLVPGLLVGAWIGGQLAGLVTGRWLQTLVAVFVLLVAAQLLSGLRPASQRAMPGRMVRAVAGAAIGLVSAMVGIGGGSMMVPWMMWHALPVHAAVATSAACGAPIALAGALAFVVAGWAHAGLPANNSGYVYWPAVGGIVAASLFSAPLGAKLAHRLPVTVLKRVFGLFLLLVGVKILVG